jgi:hypothetical protein
MHPYLPHQVITVFPQVKPRTGEREGALWSHRERWWFPFRSQPPLSAVPRDPLSSGVPGARCPELVAGGVVKYGAGGEAASGRVTRIEIS